jgi:hypothetical protein
MEQASKHGMSQSFFVNCRYGSFQQLRFFLVNKVRLLTLQMSIILLKQLVYNGHPGHSVLKDVHLALLEVTFIPPQKQNNSTLQARLFSFTECS